MGEAVSSGNAPLVHSHARIPRAELLRSPGVAPFIEHLKKGGVTVDYRPQMDAAHNTRWGPEGKESFEAFVHDHPRDPLPPKITWQSPGAGRGSRAHCGAFALRLG